MAPGFGLGVNTTVTASNLGELLALGERLAALAVPQWNLQLVTPFGRAGAHLLPPPDAVREVVSAVLARFGERLAMAVVNAPPCRLPGFERYVAADLGKLQRTMRFVTREEVNLAHYLQQRRGYEEKCEDCLFRPACGGEYK
jgi:MoaA/NifB/PqqE/SkfB family radical SAM enzyme